MATTENGDGSQEDRDARKLDRYCLPAGSRGLRPLRRLCRLRQIEGKSPRGESGRNSAQNSKVAAASRLAVEKHLSHLWRGSHSLHSNAATARSSTDRQSVLLVFATDGSSRVHLRATCSCPLATRVMITTASPRSGCLPTRSSDAIRNERHTSPPAR